MMSIRHVESNGYESIRETQCVWTQPDNQIKGGERLVFCQTDTGEPERYSTGKLYVMNSYGRTIATYYLDQVIN